MSAFTHIAFAAKSDTGRKRKGNEDSFGVFPEVGVFCVADGMGGGDDGEVASAAAVRAIETFAKDNRLPENAAYSAADMLAGVRAHLNDASSWIFERTAARRLRGCGSTFVGVVFDASRPDSATILHAGDSRLYRIRGRTIRQITRDHSAAELIGARDEGEVNPMFRGMILRAVGIQPAVDLEETPLDVEEGDRILICSDGLYRMVPDEKALATVCASDSLEAAADGLVAAANAAGGVDNVTVVLLAIGRLPAALPVVKMPHAFRKDAAEPRTAVPAEAKTQSTVGDTGASFDVAASGDTGSSLSREEGCEPTGAAVTFPEAADPDAAESLATSAQGGMTADAAGCECPGGVSGRKIAVLVSLALAVVLCGVFGILLKRSPAVREHAETRCPKEVSRTTETACVENVGSPVEQRQIPAFVAFEMVCEQKVAVAFVEKVSAVLGRDMPESIYTRFRPLAKGSRRSPEAKVAAAAALTRDVQTIAVLLADHAKEMLKDVEDRLADPSTAPDRLDELREERRKKEEFLKNAGVFTGRDPEDPDAQEKCRLMIRSVPHWF